MTQNENITIVPLKSKSTRTFMTGGRTDLFGADFKQNVQDKRCWNWGDDNLFPVGLAQMARRSATHRRILNDKADYISGKGFVYEGKNQKNSGVDLDYLCCRSNHDYFGVEFKDSYSKNKV